MDFRNRFQGVPRWWIPSGSRGGGFRTGFRDGFREDLGMVDFEIDIEWVSKMDLAMGRVDFKMDFECISLPRKIIGKSHPLEIHCKIHFDIYPTHGEINFRNLPSPNPLEIHDVDMKWKCI